MSGMCKADFDTLTTALRKKGYAVSRFGQCAAACDYMAQNIKNKVVGFGDSATLLDMGLYDALCQHNYLHDPAHCTHEEDFVAVAKKALVAEVFITSVNALAVTGELVSIDGTGNRVAGGLFGHQKVYFVVGTNKLVPTLEDAIFRARNIAAPRNAQRLGLATPCAKHGDKCYDCRSAQRICNGMAIHLNKMEGMAMEVVLVEQELGF